jgi:hypothetical protein
MSKVLLPEYMRETRVHRRTAGPFLTISRQYGCYGFSLALLLRDILNEHAPPGKPWRVFNKEILERLASETNLPAEYLHHIGHDKQHYLVDMFHSLGGVKVPSGFEIRRRITAILRSLATEGRVILVGQGGAGATQDFASGLSIRLEAPEAWRIRQISTRENIDEATAKLRIRAREREREYLRGLYERRFKRKPPFMITYDCSVFTLAQIAQQVVYAMRMKGLIK